MHWGLTHWGRVTHICVGELTIIVSDNGLSPGRRQAIIWTNAGILLIGPYETNFSEILIEILTFSFTKMSLKLSSAKWRPFCLGLNVLNTTIVVVICTTWQFSVKVYHRIIVFNSQYIDKIIVMCWTQWSLNHLISLLILEFPIQ